jgi:hypothetical protein
MKMKQHMISKPLYPSVKLYLSNYLGENIKSQLILHRKEIGTLIALQDTPEILFYTFWF